MAKLLEYGVSSNISNKIYHSDDYFTSSTAVKLLYYDIPKYESEYLRKEKVQKDNPAFAIGSYVHSLILEPEKVESEYAFFPGWDGRESGYQAFKAANVGKTVITQSQQGQVQNMMRNFNKHKVAPKFIQPSEKELTLCVDMFDVPVKVRFDAIDVETGAIYDIKTSGYDVDVDTFKLQGIGNLKYEISAGLYTMAAEQHYGKPFDFYFIVLSKKTFMTEIYKTSVQTMSNGKNRCKIGLERLKYYRENGKWPEAVQKKVDLTSEYEILEI